MGGDGRQQDGDKPEALRRQDGAGRREPLPGSEARRGNVEPDRAAGPASPKREGKVRTAKGGFDVIEESGAAAAEKAMSGDDGSPSKP